MGSLSKRHPARVLQPRGRFLHRRQRPEDPADQQDAAPTTTDATPQDGDESRDVVDAVAEGWQGAPNRVKARKEAARAVLDYAREHGQVSKREAKEKVYPEHPVEGQNARTWYRKNIRPVLNEVAEYDQSARAYRLVDDGDTVEDPDADAGGCVRPDGGISVMPDPLARRCPWCGETSLVRDGDDERCTTDGCRYGVQGKYLDDPTA
jgi:hypothetical protein